MNSKCIALLIMSCFSASLFSMDHSSGRNRTIQVKKLIGPQVFVSLPSTATIKELRKEMALKDGQGLKPEQYKLIYQGELLLDDAAIAIIEENIAVCAVLALGKSDLEKGFDPDSNLGRGSDGNKNGDSDEENSAPRFWVKAFSKKSLLAIGGISLIALAVWYFGSQSKDDKSKKMGKL